VTTAFDRKAGFVLSVIIIAICVFLFRWTFRLALFGSIFAWDILCLASGVKARKPQSGDSVWAFATQSTPGVPFRRLGRLALRPDGELEFRHRWFGMTKLGSAHLDRANTYEVGRGLLSPDIISPQSRDREYRVLFKLPPR